MHKFIDILGQSTAVDFLRHACAQDRLPHGLVFAGPFGVGKRLCADALAAWFLCQKPRGDEACGKCESCRVIGSGNHPDYHVITKELIRYHDETGKSKGIEISVKVIVPELVEAAAKTAVMDRGKFFVIEQAELMNTHAQNAMLKTLEEPAGRAAIVLLTEAPEFLLPTVLSRCQLVRFGMLDEKVVRTALEKRGIDPALALEAAKLSEGSLGGALRLINDDMLPASRQLREQIEQLIKGNPPADLPGFLKQAADAYAEKQLEKDPLGSKESATRTGLALYLSQAASNFRRRLHETTHADELERICRAIDAVAQCQMYLEANVNVAVALGQLAGAWAREFAEI